jgi:two-component system sensor histidine kinase DesK
MSSQESPKRAPQPDVRYELPAWAQYVWLSYLGFLFTPMFIRGHDWRWLWPTLVTIPVAIALYVRIVRKFRNFDPPGNAVSPELLAMALMAYALAPINDSANTYVVYCVAVAPFATSGLRRLVILTVVLLSGYGLELLLLGFKPLLFGITCIVSFASGASNYVMLEHRRKNIALRAASEEVHRLARVAERERISRDLHDLLGHTLSLIAIKSELAVKLLDRDRAGASREVVEVMTIAREALKQVRTAVTGIRSAVLEGELASARALLETAGVAVTYERDGTVLPPEVETALAMIVREAVTNIQRHARARQAWIEVLLDEEVAQGERVIGGGRSTPAERRVLLRVSDDGCGGVIEQGNGLAGIRERVRSLGGTLELDSPTGKGTVLRAWIPLATPTSSAAVVGSPAGPGAAVMAPTGRAMPAGAPTSLCAAAGELAASGWQSPVATRFETSAERTEPPARSAGPVAAEPPVSVRPAADAHGLRPTPTVVRT